MSFCEHCTKGATHGGTPKGKWEKIGGVDTYIATPTQEYPKDKAILFLPDVFGPQLINAQLLADSFADNGLKTFIPDYLNGDPIPPEALKPDRLDFDLEKWRPNHTSEKTRVPLDKVINVLNEQGITTFGATGYCFGGRFVFDLAFENVIKVAVVAHPSLLVIPEDLEKYVEASRAPLLFNSCEFDRHFTPDVTVKLDAIFEKFEPGYQREHWMGCQHGFAVRGDMTNEMVKAGKEGAFKNTVEWFIRYL